MNTEQVISMLKTVATVRPLGEDRFLVSYLGSKEAIITVKAVEHRLAADDADPVIHRAKPCPYCGNRVTVKADYRFTVHGPKKSRCPGSNTVYDGGVTRIAAKA